MKNNIEKIQEQPHPVYRVELYNLNEFYKWLTEETLESDMSLSLRSNMYHFRTREERMQFALGFDFAWDYLSE